MISRDQLLAAGYKPFSQRELKQFTTNFYQKRFDDSQGKKYFITIAEYDNRDLPVHFDDFSYSPESQFSTNGVVFDVSMHSPESVEQMEAFFKDVWKSMNCDYYERFEL